MSDNIIILGHDSNSIANLMINSKYGRKYEFNRDYPGESEYNISLFNKDRIHELLQMYLLYNKVILPQVSYNEYLGELIGMGEVEHDDIYYDGKGLPTIETFLEMDNFYAQYLKPLVLEYSSGFYIYFWGTSKLEDCLSVVYDYFYSDIKSKSLIDEFNSLVDCYLPKYIINNEISPLNIDIIRYDYIKSLKEEIAYIIRNISWELECSVRHDCPILQTNNRYRNFHYLGNIEHPLVNDAFTIITVDLGERIGSLPYFDTFDEAYQYKQDMKSQIKNFMAELKHLEKLLQTSGRSEAINKVLNDIEKAAKDLKKAKAIKSVGRWTENLLIPAEIAEELAGTKMLGVGIQLLGKGIIKAGDYLEHRGSWIQLFRK